jgi:hypothetical protein
MLLAKSTDQMPLIINHLIPTIVIAKMVETILGVTGEPMTAVVIGGNHNIVVIKEIGQIGITSTVLGHTMHNMQPCFGLFW